MDPKSFLDYNLQSLFIDTPTMSKQNVLSTSQNNSSSNNSNIPINDKTNPKNLQPCRQFKIIKSINDVKLKLKRGKDTPSIHVRTLDQYIHDFKHHYNLSETQKYFDEAKKKLENILRPQGNNKKVSINTSHLEELFGGPVPNQNDPQIIKKQFIIKRINSKVLEFIYQKHLIEIVFGSARIQDKLTTLMFIQQYRTRLPNPLLCGKIQCPRPKLPQVKYTKKSKSLPDILTVPQKQKTIRK